MTATISWSYILAALAMSASRNRLSCLCGDISAIALLDSETGVSSISSACILRKLLGWNHGTGSTFFQKDLPVLIGEGSFLSVKTGRGPSERDGRHIRAKNLYLSICTPKDHFRTPKRASRPPMKKCISKNISLISLHPLELSP